MFCSFLSQILSNTMMKISVSSAEKVNIQVYIYWKVFSQFLRLCYHFFVIIPLHNECLRGILKSASLSVYLSIGLPTHHQSICPSICVQNIGNCLLQSPPTLMLLMYRNFVDNWSSSEVVQNTVFKDPLLIISLWTLEFFMKLSISVKMLVYFCCSMELEIFLLKELTDKVRSSLVLSILDNIVLFLFRSLLSSWI